MYCFSLLTVAGHCQNQAVHCDRICLQWKLVGEHSRVGSSVNRSIVPLQPDRRSVEFPRNNHHRGAMFPMAGGGCN